MTINNLRHSVELKHHLTWTFEGSAAAGGSSLFMRFGRRLRGGGGVGALRPNPNRKHSLQKLYRGLGPNRRPQPKRIHTRMGAASRIARGTLWRQL